MPAGCQAPEIRRTIRLTVTNCSGPPRTPTPAQKATYTGEYGRLSRKPVHSINPMIERRPQPQPCLQGGLSDQLSDY